MDFGTLSTSTTRSRAATTAFAVNEVSATRTLNNVVEQDHRRVKGRLRPMLGFKTFYNARRVIIGIELAQKIHKRQFAIPITLQSNPAVTWRHVMAA